MYNLIKLGNGLKIVLEDIEYVNSVTVGLWVKNGSRNENKENNGISHFIEHMLFKGTENRTAHQIVQCIEDVGGQINAFTSKEATCFYIKVLDSYLELALELLSDMLLNSTFSSEHIEKEKGVIIEEINMNEDSPEDVLSDLHSLAAWGKDAISLPILGKIDTVKSFNREQILQYMKTYYIPENCVLSIAGNFNMKTIENIVNKYFLQWNTGQKNITRYSKPIMLNNHLYRKKDIEQLHISLGISGIDIEDNRIYSVMLLNTIFGGGASSILFQKIREEKGLCYSIYSSLSAFENTGIITIYVGLNPTYVVDVLNLIKQELDKFINCKISKEKLFKAKEQLKGNYILGLESTSSRMFNNGRSVMFLNEINTPKKIIKKIDKIDNNMLNQVKKETFGKGIINASFVGQSIDIDLLSTIIQKEVYPFKNKKSKLV